MKPVIIDCDDVLLEWSAAFDRWCGVTGQPSTWELSGWLGVEPHKALELIAEFNGSENMGFLEPVRDAPGVVLRLWERGHPLIVLTACGLQAKTLRAANLRAIFRGRIKDIFFLELGASKREHVKALHTLYGPCHYVEDNIVHAEDGRRAGHDTIVFARDHNRSARPDNPQLKWAEGWLEVLSHLN